MVKIHDGPPIVMSCYVLHNHWQLMCMDAPGYDCVERMQDMGNWVQANHILCYWEGEVAKVVGESI
jgi:hypothetical protein